MTGFLTDLADVLRGAGLTVVELDGWQGRGRSGNSPYADGRPLCVMWHHTASAGNGASDADYCTFRSPDRPLVNLVVGRDGVVYVCAAGPTNTNGKGGPLTFSRGTVPADSMNTHAVGIEISNNGVGMPYPVAQIDACFAASLAVCAAYGLAPDDVAQHWDWAPNRKIDPATAPAVEGPWQPRAVTSSGTWALDDLRDECRRRSHTTPTPPDPVGDDMAGFQLVLVDVRDDQPVYLVGLGFKTWVNDGGAWTEILARLDECKGGTVPSPWDGIVWRRFDHGDDAVIASYGPIQGDLPKRRDRLGKRT